jgi:hypothetical protein
MNWSLKEHANRLSSHRIPKKILKYEANGK